MSGFERSAPIPGSQGPRRSQMTRFNNAPPPESPWRLEVLAAKKQAEAAMRKASQRDHSRSRSRDRDRERDRRKAGLGSASSSSVRGKKEVAMDDKDALAKKIVRAREVGEGWFSAVAAASSAWEAPEISKKASGGKAIHDGSSSAPSDKRKVEDRRKPELDSRDRERVAKEDKARLNQEMEEEGQRREEQKHEQERLEKQWAAEAEERERRRLEEKKKMEDERKQKQNQEKLRKAKLGNAFAMDGDDDEADEKAKKREKEMLRKASERKRSVAEATTSSTTAIQDVSSLLIAAGATPKGDKELANNLGFDGSLDPAEAFIRLQERKRKGRRAEFGGPPRGCSPWRDGKRGVITPIAQSRIEREHQRH